MTNSGRSDQYLLSMQASADVDMPTSIVSPFLKDMTLVSLPVGVLPGRAISMAFGLMQCPSRQMNFMESLRGGGRILSLPGGDRQMICSDSNAGDRISCVLDNIPCDKKYLLSCRCIVFAQKEIDVTESTLKHLSRQKLLQLAAALPASACLAPFRLLSLE
jgi:hypothetical protein